ncbi:hypothetical protein [Roseovarius sp.]|uniref:hypothetical protein n=1 Tax=Roseovarius sp. TaxID=1486281 RepID=UPI0035636655
MTAAYYTHSAFRTLWRLGIHEVEVLRSEFEAHGYDLMMPRGPVVRHIQFKTGTARRPGTVSLARVLAEKPSGCAIWIRLDREINMGPYFWFGGAPGQPLPAIEGYPNPALNSQAATSCFSSSRISIRGQEVSWGIPFVG